MIILVAASLFLFACYAAVILYYTLRWQRATTYILPSNNKRNTVSFTIIIPARNEESNIEQCLDTIVAQDYPEHLRHVIVVDDHSTDNTAEIVKKYAAKNILLLQLKDFITDPINSYKKKAIETAMQFAQGEVIITTDADCMVPQKWLSTINGFYQENKPAFIAMPVQYDCSSAPLQIFQSLDFMTLQGITGASVSSGVHSMCNGANLAYTKKAFNAVNGFSDIDKIASGDDMLLMHKIASSFPEKISFLKSRDVIVKTAPMPTLSSFLNQRIRWASKADKYDDKRITLILFLVYFFNVILLALPVVAIFYNPLVIARLSLLAFWGLLLLAKTIVELIFLFPVASFFYNRILLWWFAPAQPFHIMYTIIAGWLGKFGSYHWKGRNVS